MSALYVETSALLAWLLGEPAGDQVRGRIDEAETVVTSVLTQVESTRALARAEHDELITARDAQAVRGLLHRTLAGWMQMEITAEVRERAAHHFPKEPVRTLDALHLSTALLFARALPDIEMLSLDSRIQANAEALGLG